MGRERIRARKYVYFCVASLIFVFLWSCSIIREHREKKELREYLLHGQKMLTQRKYDAALEAYQKVL
ncbi:MAG: hypothetical protein H6Q41_1546, partial [Deltaproteobacteria bacterium]|nr:hypothetical protein [Deltaproteobacteria bacterium]